MFRWVNKYLGMPHAVGLYEMILLVITFMFLSYVRLMVMVGIAHKFCIRRLIYAHKFRLLKLNWYYLLHYSISESIKYKYKLSNILEHNKHCLGIYTIKRPNLCLKTTLNIYMCYYSLICICVVAISFRHACLALTLLFRGCNNFHERKWNNIY